MPDQLPGRIDRQRYVFKRDTVFDKTRTAAADKIADADRIGKGNGLIMRPSGGDRNKMAVSLQFMKRPFRTGNDLMGRIIRQSRIDIKEEIFLFHIPATT